MAEDDVSGQIPIGGQILVFDRTPVARIISCAAVFGSGALFFDYLSRGSGNIHPLPLIGLGAMVLGTILSALVQYGDHIYISVTGIRYKNRWLPWFFGRSAGWMRWEEVVEVREIRRKILIVIASDSRRLLVDAIAGYAIARREILRRARHAVISGTLTREERAAG